MNGAFARTFSPKSAALCYFVLEIFLIVFLNRSASEMFVHIITPTCMEDSTSTLYPDSSFNAPNADSKPYCTSDAANSFMEISFLYGFSGVAVQFIRSFDKLYSYVHYPFEEMGPNSTCPKAISDEASLVSVMFKGGSLQLTSQTVFANKLGRLLPLQSLFGFHNIPVTFSDGSRTTFYVRDMDLSTGKFKVATSLRDPPLNEAKLNSTFSIGFNALAVFGYKECASQFKKTFRQGPGDSGFNADGTVKGSNGGICLVDTMQAGVQLSIPALIGTALALLILMVVAIDSPVFYKHRFFNIFFVATNTLCMLFLIASLAHGARIFSQEIAPCVFGTDFSNEQLMPAATRAPINGFTPSSGGFNMEYALTGATGNFKAIQSGNAAVFMKPRFRPSYGAGFGIATLVGQFIFTIVFGIKTNWAAAAASESTSDSTPIAPL